MRSLLSAVALAAVAWTPLASAEKFLMSQALSTCQDDSGFSASLFNVAYTPNNNSVGVKIMATSTINEHVNFDFAISAYGYPIVKQTIDPCKLKNFGFCPMVAGKINQPFNIPVPDGASDRIPGIAFSVPDLDARVKAYINSTKTGKSVACLEASFSNGKTVDLVGVKWATAVLAFLALLSSAVLHTLGYDNTAAHIAANSLSLFSYYQAQAIVGLTGITLPPIVQSWTQNFQWSMGIIRVGFMQKIFTWYQRSTGGTAADLLQSLSTSTVHIEKRGLENGVDLLNRALAQLPAVTGSIVKRGNIKDKAGSYLVFGIQRVAFRAKIETTNVFLTTLVFFLIFLVVVALLVSAFKGICELVAKRGMDKNNRLSDFRHGWLTILKGSLFRVCLVGFAPMMVFCLWEFTQVDSPAEVVLAVGFLLGLLGSLVFASVKVIRVARHGVSVHHNPAYILFANPERLNQYGCLYIQYRADAHYFILPMLGYTLIKALFVAFGQKSGLAQAVGFIIIEAGALIAASVMRPWMDKSTNSFNIAICAVNFVNSICLLVFTNVFDAPGLVIGVFGIVFFVLNAVFSLVLLLMIIVSTVATFFRKNPDVRYQRMGDDRASFMRSQTKLGASGELNALAATARGDSMMEDYSSKTHSMRG